MSEYMFELLAIPMCVCCGSLNIFISACVCVYHPMDIHTQTGARLAPLIC